MTAGRLWRFGYGNSFIALDSNIAWHTIQLAWITAQLEHLDRSRFPNVFAFFHHKRHVWMTFAGHDHLFDHWVETYVESRRTYRRDVS